MQRAMDRIHYVQNPVAKALVSKRVGIIDVYVPESIDLSNPFIMHLLVGISEELSKQMYVNEAKDYTMDRYQGYCVALQERTTCIDTILFCNIPLFWVIL